MPILFLFFCSGATALVYEVIWSKYLALLLGSTIQAQTVVLAVFMGGLAIGNKLFSRKADTARRPLAIYGTIEIAIGLYAFLFSFLYSLGDWVFAGLGAGLLDHPFWLLLLKGGLSVALLLLPTILMGGTLPVLAAWLQRTGPDGGRHSARFYSVNSLGAVVGAGLTGFWLVQWLGLKGTMAASAVVNVLIGSAAILIARSSQPPPLPQAPARAANVHGLENRPAQPYSSLHWGCVLVTLSGAVSMGLEVLASRTLCLVFGASLQVFAIVLMAFIIGIGIGSGLVASPSFRHLKGRSATVLLVVVTAIWICAVVFKFENLVTIYMHAQTGLTYNPVGYVYHQILTGFVSICVLGFPAALLGSVLPVWIRTVSETSEFLGDRVGRLLAWNTLGAVGGSLLTGFVIMPALGLRGAFIALAAVLVGAALLVALAARRVALTLVTAGAGAFVVVVALHGDTAWRYLISAGVFRENVPELWNAHVLNRPKVIDLEFYEDAADATVSVDHIKGTDEHSLRIDGKVDASSRGDASTQLLLAYLPLIARPQSKDVFCFGMGSGTTAGTALQYPIERLTVAENCEPVLRAATIFDPWNHGVLTNSRAHIYHEDARTVLKLERQKYDVIISEPSNPWMIGVASVFTSEFYHLAANRLKPGGIMAQWFHTYEMDDPTVNVVLHTFAEAFPSMEIWDVDDGDIVLMGSDRPWKSDCDVYAKIFDLEAPRKDMAGIGLTNSEAILARRMASQKMAFAIPDPGPTQSDDRPILEYAAPRAFYLFMHYGGVYRLPRFDERTWQSDLMDDQTLDRLAQLDMPDLKTVFLGGYGSANPDLMRFLGAHYDQYLGRAMARPMVINNRAMLCALSGGPRRFAIYTPPSSSTNAAVAELVKAEYDIRGGDPARLGLAVSTIQDVLDNLKGYTSDGTDWSPDYYADLGVKFALRMGNLPQAEAILRRGMQIQPDSDELAFLSRLLSRSGKQSAFWHE